jgi:hypothetical protein
VIRRRRAARYRNLFSFAQGGPEIIPFVGCIFWVEARLIEHKQSLMLDTLPLRRSIVRDCLKSLFIVVECLFTTIERINARCIRTKHKQTVKNPVRWFRQAGAILVASSTLMSTVHSAILPQIFPPCAFAGISDGLSRNEVGSGFVPTSTTTTLLRSVGDGTGIGMMGFPWSSRKDIGYPTIDWIPLSFRIEASAVAASRAGSSCLLRRDRTLAAPMPEYKHQHM